MLPLRASYDSFLHLQLERGGHTLMGRREIHQVLATSVIARAFSGLDKLAGACVQTMDPVIFGQYDHAWEVVTDKKVPHGTKTPGALPTTRLPEFLLVDFIDDSSGITISPLNLHFIVDFMMDYLVERQVDSIGESHANVDLIAPFANRDHFTLPAMCGSHENQTHRTRSERPTQITARF